MNSFLKDIDFFSSEVKLRILNKYQFPTRIGGVFTIFFLFLFIGLLGYFGKDIYFKMNPKYLLTSDRQ